MKYRDLMNTLRVTPEMRLRILNRLEKRHAAQLRKRRRLRAGLCAASLAACLIFALTLGISAWKTPDEPFTMNPYGAEEYASIGELSQALGFTVKVPAAIPFEPEQIVYSAMFEEFAQIDYAGDGAVLCVRMARGSEDISGDYNEYAREEAVAIGGCDVVLKGNGSTISLACWTDGTYAYAISAEPAIAREAMLRMVEDMC